ncbi:MAG: DUF948 domain-containing protein [Bacillota bacterium]|nr:DUF948 domain-containing protein [Bacillota bacterium]
MNGYIKLSDLALLLIAGAVVALSIYLILFVKNLTDCVRVFRNVLKDNKTNIDDSLKNMPAITQNISEISDTANKELKAVESAVYSFETVAQETAAAFTTIKKDVGKIGSFLDIIKFVKRLLLKGKG